MISVESNAINLVSYVIFVEDWSVRFTVCIIQKTVFSLEVIVIFHISGDYCWLLI